MLTMAGHHDLDLNPGFHDCNRIAFTTELSQVIQLSGEVIHWVYLWLFEAGWAVLRYNWQLLCLSKVPQGFLSNIY